MAAVKAVMVLERERERAFPDLVRGFMSEGGDSFCQHKLIVLAAVTG